MAQNPFDKYGQDYLASLNNAYKASEATAKGPSFLPEGKHQCYISSLAFVPNKYFPTELQFNLKLTVIEGEHSGFSTTKFYQLAPERMDMLKGDMLTLGIDLNNGVERLGDQEVIDSLLDLVVDITIKHKAKSDGKGFYQNIYIDRCLGKMPDQFMPADADDDDNPFLP